MKTIPVAQARKKFSAILKEVESGEQIGISYGRKKELIAVLVPIQEYEKFKKRKLGTLEGKGSVEFKGEWTLTDEQLVNA